MESVGIILLLVVVVAAIIIAKAGMTYLRQIRSETGYNPTGFFNSILIIGIFACLLFGYVLIEGDNPLGYVLMIGGTLACVAGLVMRNRVLGDTKRVILVTFFQLLAPALTTLGIIWKKSGGIMGNAAMRANYSGAAPTVASTSKKTVREPQYSSSQDATARAYGYQDAQDASNHGLEMKKYL